MANLDIIAEEEGRRKEVRLKTENTFLAIEKELLSNLVSSAKVLDVMQFTADALLKAIPCHSVCFIISIRESPECARVIYGYSKGEISEKYFGLVKEQTKEFIEDYETSSPDKELIETQLQHSLGYENILAGKKSSERVAERPESFFCLLCALDKRILGVAHISSITEGFKYTEEHKSKAEKIIKTATTSLRRIEGLIEEAASKVKRFRMAADASLDGIVIFFPGGDIDYLNQAILNMSEYEFWEVRKKKFLDCFLHEDTEDPVKKSVEKAVTRSEAFTTEEFVLRKKNQQPLSVQLSIYPVVERGAPSFFVALLQDIHNRKWIEQMKAEFASVVSHQFRTPLSVIQMSTTLLEQGEELLSLEERDVLIGKVARSASRLQTLVDELLDMSRLERGQIELHAAPVDLVSLIEDVLDELEDWVKEKKSTFRFEKPEGDLPEAMLDATCIRQIIHNYVVNAIQYSSEGGEVVVFLTLQEGGYEIAVKDHGLGIPEEEREGIFEKFFRAKGARQKRPDGTGLGLYTVRLIAEASGGKVWFETTTDEKEHGTTFFAFLPLKPIEEGKDEKSVSN